MTYEGSTPKFVHIRYNSEEYEEYKEYVVNDGDVMLFRFNV